MNFRKTVTSYSILSLLSATNLFAQADEVPMADSMRADGKIYVVVAVVTIILGGIIFWLFNTEKRLARLEKNK